MLANGVVAWGELALGGRVGVRSREAAAGKRMARKYVISSDSDSDGSAFAPPTSKGRVASPPAVQGKQRQVTNH